jgi:hypothetical protein
VISEAAVTETAGNSSPVLGLFVGNGADMRRHYTQNRPGPIDSAP